MKNHRSFTIAVVISAIFLLLYNLTAFALTCQEIRGDVIRLHILANSDTQEDQALKLAVRDALLAQGTEIFDGTVTPENAKEKILPAISHLQSIAEKTIRQNGYAYPVQIELLTEYFDTRTYNDEVTLPAGKYLALKVIIGEGKGQNWWCVMFPSLCLPAAEQTDKEALKAVFSEKEENIVTNQKKYSIKFKIVEYIEKIKNRVDKE